MKAADLAAAWQGENAVETLAAQIRKISGFGGKGPPPGIQRGAWRRGGELPSFHAQDSA